MGNNNHRDREVLRDEITKILEENKDMFPTLNRIGRQLRLKGMIVHGTIIMEIVGGKKELENLQLKWIGESDDDRFLRSMRNQAFTTSKDKVKKAVKKRLHTLLHANVHRLDELFGPDSVRRYLRTVPGLRAEFDEKFGVSRKEMQRRRKRRMAGNA